MILKCKNCGEILINTKTGDKNYYIIGEWDWKWNWEKHDFDFEYEGKGKMVCISCGRQIPLERLRKMGVNI